MCLIATIELGNREEKQQDEKQESASRRLAAKLMVSHDSIVATLPREIFSKQGETLGRVEHCHREYGPDKWFASLGVGPTPGGIISAQGFGSTPELAIEDAFRSARACLEESRVRLEALERKVFA